jgi:hypothetical protein
MAAWKEERAAGFDSGEQGAGAGEGSGAPVWAPHFWNCMTYGETDWELGSFRMKG